MFTSRITQDGREQPTKHHLYECANHAFNLGAKFGVAELCKVSALYHDLGKYTSEFVEYLRINYASVKSGIKPSGRGTVIHSTQGAIFIYESPPAKDRLSAALICEIASMCIANHHGNLMDGIAPDGETPFRNRLEKGRDSLHLASILTNAQSDHLPIQHIQETLSRCEDELTSFIKLCKNNHLDTAFMLHLLVKGVFSCVCDADRYNAYCFEADITPETEIAVPPWSVYAQHLEQKLATFSSDTEINRIRNEISISCLAASNRPKGVYILDVPTGGGKTLSSLRFALNHAKKHNAEHVVYVIPYLSVLEQTAADIKEALQSSSDDNFILEHHSNFIINEDKDEAQAHRLLTDRWDSPIIITTMVQFLESIYSSKGSDLRKFHNMTNSVFIFDEVQSLPLNCTHLFNQALNYLHFCAGCSVLLCTATQPPLDKTNKPINLSQPCSLIPDMTDSFAKLKRTRIINKTKLGGYTTEMLREFVINKFTEEGDCLVILNTKRDAAMLYDSLGNYIKDNRKLEQAHLVHLSTSMCPAHRLASIENIKKRKRKNTICISTQLIEAGVDISFSCVIRALAGADSIAQAAGRCNRHGEDPEGKNVYIVNIADENLSKLPSIKHGADITDRILRHSTVDLLSPDVISRYYEEYFSKQSQLLDYPIKQDGTIYDLLSRNDKGIGAYLNNGGTNPPVLRQAFETAGNSFAVIDQRTTNVYVPYRKGKILIEKYMDADIKAKYTLLRQLGRYSVSLYPHQFEKLCHERAITAIDDGIYVLDDGYYHDKLGVIFKAEIKPMFA